MRPTFLPLYRVSFLGRALRNCLRTNKTPKHKILKLSIVVTLLMRDYCGFVTWTNYFTSRGLISELQVSPKVLFKGGFEGEHPEIALTTTWASRLATEKVLKDYLDSGIIYFGGYFTCKCK